METTVLRNQIDQNLFEVYAFHPSDRKLFESKINQIPHNWILYPNPLCEKGAIEQADLTDENLKEFLFSVVLPKSNFIIGNAK